MDQPRGHPHTTRRRNFPMGRRRHLRHQGDGGGHQRFARIPRSHRATGAGPVAHAHGSEDEAFYLLSGEFEFLNGDETFVAGPGDFIFIPRGNRHRFKNVGEHPARMLVLFTPGGHEGTFIEIGDEPREGEQAPEWGPEQYAKALDSLVRYNVTLMPEDPQ